MPRHRSRSRSVRRYASYESFSESSEDDRGRPITRLINLIRPRSRSASININQNIYQGDTFYDEDTINGPVYQAGNRPRAIPRKAGNNYGGNHVHNHYPHYDDSDDDDYNDGSSHCHCLKCDAAAAAAKSREKREKALKAAKKATKEMRRDDDAFEKRLRAMKLGGSRILLRDRADIEFDVADCNKLIENVQGFRQHIYRARSRSRPKFRPDAQFANLFP